MIEIEQFLKELEAIKASQKALAEKEILCKTELLEFMKTNYIDKEESSYGTVRIQRRNEKDYGSEIKAMEEELKLAKKLKDDLGDYKIISYKESIVYTSAKELF
jgi:hypothetical protein